MYGGRVTAGRNPGERRRAARSARRFLRDVGGPG